MSTENYTQKTLEAIRDAQALAQEKNNQYLTPEHLLYALLKQDGGLIGSASLNPEIFLQIIQAANQD